MSLAALMALATLCGCATPSQTPERTSVFVPVTSLPGWSKERVADVLPVLARGCARLALAPPDQPLGGSVATARLGGQVADWSNVCTTARLVPPGDEAAARAYMVGNFDAYRITDSAGGTGLFTGYYEPEVAGSRERTKIYHVAVLSRPNDLVDQKTADGHRFGRLEQGQLVSYFTRAEIDAGRLRRQRLDILYLNNAIDLFFMQIQGFGRVDLPNGHVVRLGYSAGNGQDYVPIGRALEQRGNLAAQDVSAQSLRAWLQAHPREARAIMELDPSYTFFRELPDLSPTAGPVGTLGVQLTPSRSIAVDESQIPLGAPVWIDTTDIDGSPLQRLVLAQDTGSATKGIVRADIFFGWGATAEAQAGRLHAQGHAWLLLPKARRGSRP